MLSVNRYSNFRISSLVFIIVICFSCNTEEPLMEEHQIDFLERLRQIDGITV